VTCWSTSRPFPKTGFRGGRAKINAAMSYGSSVGNGKHDVARGFDLLAKTVSTSPASSGSTPARSSTSAVQADRRRHGRRDHDDRPERRSEHLQPNGQPRPRLASCANNKCAHPYYGPQKTYKKGTYHLEGWEALDYVRQRYGLPDSDYDRQRHQQQFIKAMASRRSARTW
jgi:hypothetical protein